MKKTDIFSVSLFLLFFFGSFAQCNNSSWVADIYLTGNSSELQATFYEGLNVLFDDFSSYTIFFLQ